MMPHHKRTSTWLYTIPMYLYAFCFSYQNTLHECRDLFVEYCQKGHAFPEDDIRTLECQFSRLVGTPVVVLYNAKTVQRGEVNMRACRLSTDITTGQHTKVCCSIQWHIV